MAIRAQITIRVRLKIYPMNKIDIPSNNGLLYVFTLFKAHYGIQLESSH
jgi:hypothetical protein